VVDRAFVAPREGLRTPLALVFRGQSRRTGRF